ncbi:Optomotor-blind protein [Frankliniella fusca]|uniref:Optomotor-blind protein n=1 Tax=Frankliniella fusca TaxID=407009 RepID=A0AAE1IYT7_9NEOP|nr:Optomotor-blind protein [Frankliniella fusca]
MPNEQSLLAQRVTDDSKGGPRPDSTAAHLSPSHLQAHGRPPSSTGSSVHDDPGAHYRHLGATSDCPTPNVSVGPPPPLLPYLYPPSLYPPFQAPPLSLFGAGGHGVNPSLLLNAQLALAAQQFGHYPHLGQPAGSLNQHLKAAMAGVAGGHANRFSPYPLPGGPGGPGGPGAGAAASPLSPSRVGSSPLGSAFEAVTPGSSLLTRPPSGSPSSPPPGYPHLHHNHPAFPGARDLLHHHHHHHPARRSPTDSRSRSTSPSSRTSPTSGPAPSSRRSPSPASLEVVRLSATTTTPAAAAQPVSTTTASSPSSQIRSIERMVNGLDGTAGTPRSKAGSAPSSPGTAS